MISASSSTQLTIHCFSTGCLCLLARQTRLFYCSIIFSLIPITTAIDLSDCGRWLKRVTESLFHTESPKARFHDNSSTDISSTTLRLQTFRLQTFRLLLYTSVQDSYTSNFCFRKSLFS